MLERYRHCVQNITSEKKQVYVVNFVFNVKASLYICKEMYIDQQMQFYLLHATINKSMCFALPLQFISKPCTIVCFQGAITNILEENVVQPLLVSTSAIHLATETVKSIMKIDDIVSTCKFKSY